MGIQKQNVVNLFEMQERFRTLDGLEEVLDLPNGWKAEKAEYLNLPHKWNIK